MVTAIINNDSLGLFLNGSLITIKSDNPHFEDIKDAIKQKNDSLLLELVDKASQINKFGGGKIKVVDGVIYYNDNILDNHLTQRVSQLLREGFDVSNLINFIENLYQNPSKRSVQELYLFLEKYALPITEDGYFLAYKAVRNDYTDIWTGTIDNSVGSTTEMDRNLVCDDKTKPCSQGLHLGAISYAKKYGNIYNKPEPGEGNRLMIVKCNPVNVVCVPEDSVFAKVRTCGYKVIAEMADYNTVLDNAVYTSDAQEKAPENEIKVRPTDSDQDFFVGRRDGELNAQSGIPYSEPDGVSNKYLRGYKRGYIRSGISLK